MMMMTATAPSREETVRRKVTASGVIWLDGRSYYVSRRLAGRTIPIKLIGGKLLVEATIPLRKEYVLPGRTSGPVRRPRGWRTAGAVG
jgi:hypothetical protein